MNKKNKLIFFLPDFFIRRSQRVIIPPHTRLYKYPDMVTFKKTTLRRSHSPHSTCDIIQNSIQRQNQNPNKIVWKFEVDIVKPNNPDVVKRTFSDAVVSTKTTTLW